MHRRRVRSGGGCGRLRDPVRRSACARGAGNGFSRGPRTPEPPATARLPFAGDGILPFSGPLAALAADVFRRLGSPRRRAADIAVGVTAAPHDATLMTRSARDFRGIPSPVVEDLRTSG